MREVRPDAGARFGAPNGVAHEAGLRHEDVRAFFPLVVVRFDRWCSLRVAPVVEQRRRERHDDQPHVSMLPSAELSALAAINPRLAGGELQLILLSWDE